MYMKTSGFKQKTFEETRELKRKFQEKEMAKRLKERNKLKAENQKRKAKEKKENNLTALQTKLWNECKRIIRKRYQTKTGSAYCYTCGKWLIEPRDQQTGHMFAKAVCPPHMKYDLTNLRVQCYHCNINLGGNGAIFIENMRKIEGDAYVDNIKDHCFKAENYQKVDADYYKKLLEEYKTL